MHALWFASFRHAGMGSYLITTPTLPPTPQLRFLPVLLTFVLLLLGLLLLLLLLHLLLWLLLLLLLL
jgi:hypothetical protein